MNTTSVQKVANVREQDWTGEVISMNSSRRSFNRGSDTHRSGIKGRKPFDMQEMSRTFRPTETDASFMPSPRTNVKIENQAQWKSPPKKLKPNVAEKLRALKKVDAKRL